MQRASQATDGELLAAVVAGDGEAFAAFYRRHLPAVVAFLLRETRDREATADLTAEVFAAVFLVARRFRARGAGSVRPWVLGIARNKLLESRRRGRIEDRARFLLARGGGAPDRPPAVGHGDVSLVLTASPAHPTAPVLDRTIQILRERLRSVFPDAEVTRTGGQIVVDVRNAPAGARSEVVPSGAPNAKVYVLRGPPALSGTDLTNPGSSSDPNTGIPDVTFDFTAAGRRAFKQLTAQVARRGARDSSAGEMLNQHFAIALDGQLLTVPFIDFKQYPDGINGDHGADIAGNLTSRSARDLAILLRFGPLPADFRAAG